ncbi:MAG: acid phosphatase [Gemmatimonadetes bacterium]|nr:acid phosphatase [Gemmatimonadota bacterium]
MTRTNSSRLAVVLGALLAAAAFTACSLSQRGPSAPDGITKINHVVVIYLENRSFDNMYGEFPGADGQAQAASAPRQISSTGEEYATLPQLAGQPYPTNLPNRPFDITQFVPATVVTHDLVHKFYQEQAQINGGKMNRFAAISDAQGQSMGYYHTMTLPVAAEAAKYTLCDRFFHSAFGSSFLNHQFLISAVAPSFTDAPAALRAVIDPNGMLINDAPVTPDGFAVNTMYSVNNPHPKTTPPANLVPSQTNPTIGDRLSEKNISWAWYAGGWNEALAGIPDRYFQYHHQPFVYFANYADGTSAKAEHLKDEKDFVKAAAEGTLPAVSFVKPIGLNNEHAGYADIMTGERHTIELINAVRNGPNWNDTAIIITYDENGGWWDHVAPPKVDRWGPGTRVPTIVISPYAKKGFIDHTPLETTSILAFIEARWGLKPLSTHDAKAANLTSAFDFSTP